MRLKKLPFLAAMTLVSIGELLGQPALAQAPTQQSYPVPNPSNVPGFSQKVLGTVSMWFDSTFGYPRPASTEHPMPTAVIGGGGKPSSLTAAPPDVTVVTTGGTAVTAFAAGHVSAGGWLFNPPNAAAPLCVNEAGAAVTTNVGSTICLLAGQTYTITPSLGSVSVNSTDTAHVFARVGRQ
jgi:hypothetical protein